MKFLIMILALELLTACTSQKEIMDSWLGSTKQQLIMKWGPPVRTASDGSTGEILVYAKHVYRPPRTSTFYDSYGGSNTTTTPAVNYWDYKFFYADSEGKIYHWLKQRQQIPPTQIDLTIYKGY